MYVDSFATVVIYNVERIACLRGLTASVSLSLCPGGVGWGIIEMAGWPTGRTARDRSGESQSGAERTATIRCSPRASRIFWPAVRAARYVYSLYDTSNLNRSRNAVGGGGGLLSSKKVTSCQGSSLIGYILHDFVVRARSGKFAPQSKHLFTFTTCMYLMTLVLPKTYTLWMSTSTVFYIVPRPMTTHVLASRAFQAGFWPPNAVAGS